MNMKELQSKSQAELQAQLETLLKNQFDLRMAKGNGQLTKVNVLKEVRRDIARVKTLLRQNELATEKAGNE